MALLANPAEVALRAALLDTNSRNQACEQGKTDDLKTTALTKVKGLIPSSDSEVALASSAIAVAMFGLTAGYLAVSKQITVLHEKRVSFEEECKEGIATFKLPTNLELRKYKKEEKIIKAFIKLTNKQPDFATYLGIHKSKLANQENVDFYSVLPFYSMSAAMGQPPACTGPLDRQQRAISLFLKSEVPDSINSIEADFQKDIPFFQWFLSIYRNYLNKRRAPRFIMMTMANLLWNLMHPVNPKTGYPLDPRDCVVLCRRVEEYINNLLNPQTEPVLQSMDNEGNQLINFLRKIELFTQTLREAYKQEQLEEFSLDYVSKNAHEALNILDTNVFKLVYRDNKNKEPDGVAAERLANTFNVLSRILKTHPSLANYLRVFSEKIPPGSMVNKAGFTVIDVLIICCHLTQSDKKQLLASLKESNRENEKLFHDTLRDFYRTFVRPIKTITRKELGARWYDRKSKEVGELTARRLIPLFTLAIGNGDLDVDNPLSNAPALSEGDKVPIRTAKEQIHLINEAAKQDYENPNNGYYTWAISPFIDTLDNKTAAGLDSLPAHQYRMTQITKLIDSVNELVNSYRMFLQHKSFQLFLRNCFENVKEEYAEFAERILEVRDYMDHADSMSRTLKDILSNMTTLLGDSLESFARATADFERLLNAPDFTEQQRRIAKEKVGSVHKQYWDLFKEDSGISHLIEETEHASSTLPPQTPSPFPRTVVSSLANKDKDVVDPIQAMALTRLVQDCLNGLSYQSRNGQKGRLLRDLLGQIEEKELTSANVKKAIMILVQVTCCYRPNIFFQASYAKTSSSEVLKSAIRDSNLNSRLPLAAIIFDESTKKSENLSLKLKDGEIMERLQTLRISNKWSESIINLHVVAGIDEVAQPEQTWRKSTRPLRTSPATARPWNHKSPALFTGPSPPQPSSRKPRRPHEPSPGAISTPSRVL